MQNLVCSSNTAGHSKCLCIFLFRTTVCFVCFMYYRIISNIGGIPIKVPLRAYPIFPVQIVSTPGHWN